MRERHGRILMIAAPLLLAAGALGMHVGMQAQAAGGQSQQSGAVVSPALGTASADGVDAAPACENAVWPDIPPRCLEGQDEAALDIRIAD